MITVIVPVLNEAPTVASVVAFARRDPSVSEVLVVDDGSIDGTPELARAAGARVITSTMLGKGASMADGMRAARNELLLYLDGDLRGLHNELVQRMTRPLVQDEADFVKARFSRAAGRVTTLTAKPLLRIFFPELAHFEQPLAGVIAARRGLLKRLRFENDYGVDIGLFLDAAATGARLAEVDIGHLEHESQPLECLVDMAAQVTRALLHRAARYGRLRRGQIFEAEETERRAQSELAAVIRRLGGGGTGGESSPPRTPSIARLALFDMDGVLLDGRFVVRLARRTNRSADLAQFLDNPHLPAEDRSRRIAALFAGVRHEVFEQVARDMPLTPGAVETVVSLRQTGYRVGVVTDSYQVVAEVVRRRVFADFSFAHQMRFHNRRATGELTLSPGMFHAGGCRRHEHCKVNVMRHLLEGTGLDAGQVLAVGDGENDICLLQAAGTSVAYRPKTAAVGEAAQHVVTGALSDILFCTGWAETPGSCLAAPAPIVVGPAPSLDVGTWG